MSNDNQENINQGTRLAAKGTAAGAKAAVKIGKKTGKMLLSRKGRIILAVVLIVLILAAVLEQGVPGSSFRRVYRQSAVGEERDYNNPKTQKEAYESIYNDELAVEDTVSLVDIIHSAKQKDLENINDAVESAIRAKAGQEQYTYAAGDVDIDLSVQMATRETAESSKYAYRTNGSSAADTTGSTGSAGTTSAKASSAGATSEGQRIVDTAMKYVGKTPYKRGGTSLKTGLDCTAFVWRIYNLCGYKMNAHFGSKGKSIGKNIKDAQPGDVIKYPHHWAIYAGKKKIVHAAGVKYGVIKSSYTAGGKVLDIRRYVKDTAPVQGGAAGSGTTAREYKKLTTLKTLSASSGTIVKVTPVSGHTFQSFTFAGNDIYLQSVPTGAYGRNGYIYKAGADGKITSRSAYLNIGHGNGLTYCTKDSTLYSVTVNGIGNNRKAVKINPGTLKQAGTKSLEHGTSAIAYDRVTNRFITSSGSQNGSPGSPGYLYVYKSNLRKLTGAKSIKKLRWKTPGDIAAYNGVVYVTVFSGGKNYIDMYSENTGGYLGTYEAPYAEIEGIDIDAAGQIVLLFNSAYSSDFLQYTGIKTAVADESAGMAGTDGTITKLDMDILAAYNISISNTSMYMKTDAIKEGSSDGWLDKKGYTDVSGKAVKLYWFGKNRGQINYEKDLDSKVDALIKGDAKKDGSKHFYKITVGTSTETVESTDEDGNTVEKKIVPVTIKEAEADTVMKSMFGLDPDKWYVNTTGVRRTGKSTGEKEKDKAGTAKNLEATYSLSDTAGRLLFGELVEIQNPSFDAQADMAMGAVSIGTQQQKAILDYINKHFPPGKADPYRNGWAHKCLGWCAHVYNGAGISLCAKGTGRCCASAHREAYATKRGNIPPGALIYSSPSVYKSKVKCGSCGRNAGHVAIYIGNGKIAGSQPPYIITLEQWNKTYGYGGWSFGGNSFTSAAAAAASKDSSSGVSSDKIKSGKGTKKDFQKYAKSLFKKYGWSDSELKPLKNLWNKESGWNPAAHNKSSGAHGIPQALPASKMASEGSDYYTNGYTQIRWGLKYIKNRYGSPSKAWKFWKNNNWY